MITLGFVISRVLVRQKEKAVLRSDAVQCAPGSLTRAISRLADRGRASFHLGWEFHVPASSCPTRPGQNKSEFGVKATGWLQVSHELYQAHALGLPKDCTVRYLPADPSYNQLVKVGDDDRPSRERMGMGQWILNSFSLVIVCVILIGGSSFAVIFFWSRMEPGAFFAVVGIFAVLSIVVSVRVYMRLAPCPGICGKEFTVAELNAPYQKPQPQPPLAQHQVQLTVPIVTVTGTPLNVAPAHVTEAPAPI